MLAHLRTWQSIYACRALLTRDASNINLLSTESCGSCFCKNITYIGIMSQRSERGDRSSPLRSDNPNDQLLSEASQASASRHSRTSESQLQSTNLATASSPLFFRSSPGNPSASGSLRHSTPRGPRLPSAALGGECSSLIREASSPPRSSANAQAQHLSSTSGLFVATPARDGSLRARDRRGEISSDYPLPNDARRQRREGTSDGARTPRAPASGAATFSNLDPTTSEADRLAGDHGAIIWGSNVPTEDAKRHVRDFLMNFEKRYRMIADGELDASEALSTDHPGREKEYIEMMNTMLELGATALNLDLQNLKAYPPTRKLWKQLQDFPSEVIMIFDTVLKQTLLEIADDRSARVQQRETNGNGLSTTLSSSAPAPPSSEAGFVDQQDRTASSAKDLADEVALNAYRVRPFNLSTTTNLRELNPGDMDRVVSIKGLVIRTTPVIPDMREAFFQCGVCNHTLLVEIARGKIAEPTICPREQCKQVNAMQIVHNRSMFSDKQVIKLQETPDSIPDGQTPHSVSLCVYNELVDFCKAGDRIEVTGIFKCNQVRVNPRQRTVKNVYKTFIDVLHIKKSDKKRLGADSSTLEQQLSEQAASGVEEVRKISEEEEVKIKQTAERADVYELLSRSLAPSIWEMDDVKKGILLQLFGGTNKSFEKGGHPKYRGDINILLCGDPSTSKSQILQYVNKIAPRGVYTSGKGSSAVGLTAYVTRDPETRQLVLESGALVLSDGGVCCIDEFDKMSDATRSVLHEVMEQQTVSIAKAGIITTLNARTSILASANPIGSKYNPNLSVPQNIDLPPTLLSRFDLVYLVLDRIEEQTDRRLAKHLVSMYLEDTPDNANSQEILPVEFLTAYISYAKAHCQPRITEGAQEELVKAYVAMRKLGEDVRAAERRITATTRQLESMIRLAEAHAKMQLSDEVTRADVIEAVRLIQSALKQAATDSRTGLIDMSLLTEGTSAGERRRKQDLKTAIIELLDGMTRQGGNVRYRELAERLAEQSSVTVEADEVSAALKALQQEGQLQILGEGARRTIRRATAV
ncbi:hypothetical protein MRB53_037041 [Persea americana]|nr:hypothetical protein MRB53_037041 [Persea americana]